jgi:hypothetical protein
MVKAKNRIADATLSGGVQVAQAPKPERPSGQQFLVVLSSHDDTFKEIRTGTVIVEAATKAALLEWLQARLADREWLCRHVLQEEFSEEHVHGPHSMFKSAHGPEVAIVELESVDRVDISRAARPGAGPSAGFTPLELKKIRKSARWRNGITRKCCRCGGEKPPLIVR